MTTIFETYDEARLAKDAPGKPYPGAGGTIQQTQDGKYVL